MSEQKNTLDQEPTANSTELRSKLSDVSMNMHEVREILRSLLPQLEGAEALAFLKKKGEFGIAALMDSPEASLVEIDEEFVLQFPVSELFVDVLGNLSFSGACQQIQKSLLIVLSAMTSEDMQVEPLREWYKFVKRKGIDYYHFYIGRQRAQTGPLKKSPLRVLDLSKFYSRLSFLRGSMQKNFGFGVGGSENAIEGQNNLSAKLQPYCEIELASGVGLVSVGMRREGGVRKVTLSLDIIADDNLQAPAALIELVYDVDQDALIEGNVSDFERYISWTEGSTYQNTTIGSEDEVEAEYREVLLAVRQRFFSQLQRLEVKKE